MLNPTTVQVGTGILYEFMQVIDRVGGYELRRTDSNTTGFFIVNQAGIFTIRVTGSNGCQQTTTGIVPPLTR